MLNMQDASSLPPFHPLRLAARSAAPARLVHQGQLPSSSLGVSANVSRRSFSRTSGPACLPSTRLPRPIRRRSRPSPCTNTEHCTTAPSRPLASAYDPAAQQPAHGSTMQAGAVGGVGGLDGGWRCSCGPRYLARVPLLFVHRPVVVFPVCTARSHAALLHDAASALADARVITPKGLNLGAGLVPGGRGRAAAASGAQRQRRKYWKSTV